MSLAYLMLVDHLAILDQADEIVAMHTAPAFEPYRKRLQDFGLAVDFYDTLMQIALQYRSTLVSRDNAEVKYEAEAAQVREVTEKAAKWVRILHTATRGLKSERNKLASNLATLLRLGDAATSSNRLSHNTIARLVQMLAELTDVSALNLPPNFLQDGREILASFPVESSETSSMKMHRDILSIQVAALHDQLHLLLEKLVARRDMVEAVDEIELPGFDFGLLRAAAAPRSAEPADPSGAPATPPAAEPPGL